MGLLKPFIDFIEECIDKTAGKMRGISMLELGDQTCGGHGIKEATGKEYFETRGVYHTSVDMNGKHGALVVDLTKCFDNPDWVGAFNVVTNSGTSEHVAPFEGQYTCFQNIHDCLKVNGVAIHIVPDVADLSILGRLEHHCPYYYSEEFFRQLIQDNAYKLIALKTYQGLLLCCYQKKKKKPFSDDAESFLKNIYIRHWGRSAITPDVERAQAYARLESKTIDKPQKDKHGWESDEIPAIEDVIIETEL